MQQKVAIARAFLTSPVLLLLDEPTTGLDPRSKLEVQAFIEEIRDQHDATIVLTTHDLDEAERLCSRIGLLNDGRLVAEGTVSELKAASGRRSQPMARHARPRCTTYSWPIPVAHSTTTSRRAAKTTRTRSKERR